MTKAASPGALGLPSDALAGGGAQDVDEAAFIDDCDAAPDSGDEFETGPFHDRLANVYREFSPSRRRRLAQGEDGSLGFGIPSLGGGFTTPQLSDQGTLSVFTHAPLGQGSATTSPLYVRPPGAAFSASSGSGAADIDSRRPSAVDSEREEILNADLKLRSGEAKLSAASSQPPSSLVGHASDCSMDERRGLPGYPSDATAASGSRATAEAPDFNQQPKPPGAAGDSSRPKMAWEEGMVTVMIRQIPRHYTQLMLLGEVLRRGFKGLFDFIYLPFDMKKGASVGYGFINFIDPKYTSMFHKEFDGSFLDAQMRAMNKPLRVHPASVQGYEGNRAHFLQTKTGQKQDPQFRPLFFPGGSWAMVTDRALLEAEHATLRVHQPGCWDGVAGAPPGVLAPTGAAADYSSAALGMWNARPHAQMVPGYWQGHAGALGMPDVHAAGALGMSDLQAAGYNLCADFQSLEEEKAMLLAELAAVQSEQCQTLAASTAIYAAAATNAASFSSPEHTAR